MRSEDLEGRKSTFFSSAGFLTHAWFSCICRFNTSPFAAQYLPLGHVHPEVVLNTGRSRDGCRRALSPECPR